MCTYVQYRVMHLVVSVCVLMYVCVCACVCVCMYVCTCMYVLTIYVYVAKN